MRVFCRSAIRVRPLNLGCSSSLRGFHGVASTEEKIWQQFKRKDFAQMRVTFDAAQESGMTPQLKSFNLMLRKAELERDDSEAIRVFQSIKKSGLRPNGNSFRFLINCLSDCGRTEDAVSYLQEFMRTPGASADEAVPAMYARLALQDVRLAERLIGEMRIYGVPVTDSVLAAALKARAKSCGDDAQQVERVVKDAMVEAGEVGAAMLEAAVGALHNVGLGDEARKLYAVHGRRCGQEQEGRAMRFLLLAMFKGADTFKEAESLMVQARSDERTRPDGLMYHYVFLALRRDTTLDEKTREANLNATLTKMRSEGVIRNKHTSAAIAGIYAECGKPWMTCLELSGAFKESLYELVEALASIMTVLKNKGADEEALKIWDYAVQYNAPLPLNAQFFTAAILACLVKTPRGTYLLDKRFSAIMQKLASSHFSPDEHLFSAILRVHGRAGQVQAALHIFQALLKGQVNNVRVTKGLMKTMLNVLANDPSGVVLIPQLMLLGSKEFGIAPDVGMYNACISSLKHTQAADVALRMYEDMKKHGITPDAGTYNALFTVLDRVPSTRSLEEEKTIEKRIHFLLHDWYRVSKMQGKDVVTNNLLLKAMQNRPSGKSEGVFWRIFRFMISSDDPSQWPTSYTYHIVLKGLIRRGSLEKATNFVLSTSEKIDQKRARGQDVDGFWKHTIENLVGMLLAEERVDLAETIIQWAAARGFQMGPPLVPGVHAEDDD